ncbi:hypothetical protein Sjap_002088 [Stephania japonica]|uniref:Uncharacterized protein n=1 Tax=Stephania japonica TaxID=461633 RepID=A0AAP0KMT5_9MAGN
MNNLQKLKSLSFLKWGFSDFYPNNCVRSKTLILFYSSRVEIAEDVQTIEEIRAPKCSSVPRVSCMARKEAQRSLLEYLHCTRNLPFSDAEHISKNSPSFLNKLLKKVKDEQQIGQYLTKHFQYNPIHEFEPFFESIGLKRSEIDAVLPHSLMFLSDDDLLLENYRVLCNYGVDRSKIGKIYREVREVFGYDHGVLRSKLQAYEDLGLSRAIVIKVVASSPSLLIGVVNCEFVEVLEMLKKVGIEHDWIKGQLSEKTSYQWNRMLRILSFFNEIFCSEEEVSGVIQKHPGLMLDGSGSKTFSLITVLVKLGFKKRELSSLFLHFPRIQVGTFTRNFRQALLLLIEIEMVADDVVKIIWEHSTQVGSFPLKKPISIFNNLKVRKKRLCNMIMEDPHQLKNRALELRVNPLPNSDEKEQSQMQKTEFFLKLGFVPNSEEMKKSLKVCHGKGEELQERFDCFVKAGLDKEVVCEMIKVTPRVLNQTKHVIESKIDFLVNDLGYPISSIAIFPYCIAYAVERVKLRFSMYNWLKEQGAASLALSTILASSDKDFVKSYVEHHPQGLEVWEKLKKEFNVQRRAVSSYI